MPLTAYARHARYYMGSMPARIVTRRSVYAPIIYKKRKKIMAMALDGIKVLDLSRLAPGPYCSMLLADFGAEVLLVEAIPGSSKKLGSGPQSGKEGAARAAAYNALGRGKRSIALNLKNTEARKIFLELVDDADVVLEGFRPGVVERLGVDYETISTRNPGIVYCSLSGFGQNGPYSDLVGHDINYISIGGGLGVIGRPGTAPAIPVNILADFAGGGLFAAFSICIALLSKQNTGKGQYIDMAMSDGVLSLMTSAFAGFFASGTPLRPGEGFLTGARPWYDTYQCSDGRWFSIGSIEPHFYNSLCQVLETEEYLEHQHNEKLYPEMKEKFAEIFLTKTAEAWMDIMSKHDICASPVLEQENVPTNPHNIAREMILELETSIGLVQQIGIAPKLSGTPGKVSKTAPLVGEDTTQILIELGYSTEQIKKLQLAEVIG
jgi:crotonobetainyl-CoA:carnitine CoA-transferase CaiB-like acyl-CoA transferase